MSEQDRFDRKEKLKKLELRIWAKKENVAKWVALGIISGMLAITMLITFLANS